MDAPAADPATCLAAALRELLPSRGLLAVAVSGGSDSMAAAALAAAAAPDRVALVHVEHGLRAEALADADFVEQVARSAGLPCLRLSATPDAHDPARTETAARRRRLLAFSRAATELGAAAVLAAHHLDDQVETLLLRLRRGHRSDRALAGIPLVRRLGPPDHAAPLLLRPFLLGADRAALSSARTAAGWPCRHDTSNADLRIPRNRVRHWLAGTEPALRPRVLELARRAAGRLQHRRLRAAAALERGLSRAGHGLTLPLAALQATAGADRSSTDEDRAELLRLLGHCLARPRRVDPRAGVLRQLQGRLDQAGGRLALPAQPAPLLLHFTREALHLPHESLRVDDPAQFVAAALLAEPVPVWSPLRELA